MKISAKVTTLLKTENRQSVDLQNSEKVPINGGETFSIKSISWDSDNHAKVTLGEGKLIGGKSHQEVYIYAPDWIIPYAVLPRSIKLDVDYYYQRDNSTNLFGTGDRQCKLTCSAMLANHCLKLAGLPDLKQRQKNGGYREPESVYGNIMKPYGDTIYNQPHINALRDLKIKAYYSTSVELAEIRDVLLNNIPIPISVDYKSGGHIILVVGYDKDKNFFWVHDPYGSRAGAAHAYNDRSPLAGKYDTYSWGLMEKIYSRYWNRHALLVTQAGDYITGVSSKL